MTLLEGLQCPVPLAVWLVFPVANDNVIEHCQERKRLGFRRIPRLPGHSLLIAIDGRAAAVTVVGNQATLK
jgi:hypothetical protein